MPRLLRILVLACSVAFVAAITWFGIYTLVNAYMTRDLGRSDADWASATLWLTGGMVVWQLLAAPIANLLGRTAAMALALAAGGVAYGVIAATRSPHVIGPMLGLMGLTQAMVYVVFVPLMAELGGDRPGRALAAYQWIVTVVTVASIVLGGAMVDRWGFGYAPVFWGIAGISLLCAGLFAWFARGIGAADARPAVGLHNLTRADLKLLRGPFLVVLILGLSAEPFYYHMINQLFPNLARETHGLGVTQIGAIVALGRLPSLLSIAFVAQRIDRGNPILFYAGGIVASAAVAICIAWTTHEAWAIGLYLTYYLCHGVVWGANCSAANATIPPRLRELAFTIICLVQAGFAYGAGVLHQDMLARGHSIREVFAVSGGIALLAGVGLLIYALTVPRERLFARASAAGSEAEKDKTPVG